MKRIFAFMVVLLFVFQSVTTISADYANMTGGSGGTGTGTYDNGWLIIGSSGGYIFDTEGMRVYIADSTGNAVKGYKPIDITNSNVSSTNVWNGGQKTKSEYKASSTLTLNDYYTRYIIDTTKTKALPSIIPWGESDSTNRINKIKEWFLDTDYVKWICEKIGIKYDDFRNKNYLLGIEPIAYFRYLGDNYALTATECAILDKMVNGGLFNRMNPLTHSNLPLSIFLKTDLGLMKAWTGASTGRISNNQSIIDYLGIGYVEYDPVLIPADTLKLNFSIKATPDEEEVISENNNPVKISSNVNITVKLQQDADEYKKWVDRLNGASDIKVTMTLKEASSNRNISCITNSKFGGTVLGGTAVMVSKEELLSFLKPTGRNLVFKDPCANEMINADQMITYKYTFNIVVSFTDAERYTTAGQHIPVPSTPIPKSDTASFYRKKLPPEAEYMNYFSNPTAYAEIKQGTIYNEEYEAMAGTPTTRDLYLGVGGSEFIVDFSAALKKELTATRKYTVHYDGCECEFKEGDQAKSFTFPSPSGGGLGNVSISSMHSGGSCTVTWTGTTPWTGSGGVSGHIGTVTNSWNDTAYKTALSAANSYAASVNGTVYSYTSASDKQTRTKSSWGASASGSNPHISGSATTGQPYIAPSYDKNGKMTSPGQEFIPGTYTPGQSNTWTITVTWTVPAHTCCGPCCQHDLPAINDTWTQEIKYDYVDILKSTVWNIDQGYIDGLSVITGGTNSVLASIMQGSPTIFSNIAATETSSAGRFRYSLEPGQHDNVTWNKGSRSNKCNKQDKDWGTGILYNNTSFPHQSGYLEAKASEKDKKTAEYAEFKANREKLVTATVISDFLILQTSSGDQSVLYFDKKSNAVQAQNDYDYVKSTLSEVWTNNTKSAAKWTKGHINIGSYNGKYANTLSKYTGTGSNNKIATAFDSDVAGKITRTARPSSALRIAKYNIDILDTLPNDDYKTGNAQVFWQLAMDYNPDNNVQLYSISPQPIFGGKSGYAKTAGYSPTHTKVNDIVIHNPVSADYAMVLAVDQSRDQRGGTSVSWASQIASKAEECPSNPEECEYRYLSCKYTGGATHISNCYTEETPYTLNAHEHSAACIDNTKLQNVFKRETYQVERTGTRDVVVQKEVETPFFVYKYKNIIKSETSASIYITSMLRNANDWTENRIGITGKTDTYLKLVLVDAKNITELVGSWGSPRYITDSNGHTIGVDGVDVTTERIDIKGAGTYYLPVPHLWQPFFYPILEVNFNGTGTNRSVTIAELSIVEKNIEYVTEKETYTYYDTVEGDYYGTIWGLTALDELSRNGATASWISQQPSNAVIFNCGRAINKHICDVSCQHESILLCTEPHHMGLHYDISNSMCWSACLNNANHKHKSTGLLSGVSMGNFINLDWGFQIYFPTIGDFYESGALGLSQLTNARGKGYINNMQTSEWVAKKRAKFEFDVIYCGATTALNVNGSQHGNSANGSDNHKHTSSCVLYKAGTWIDIPKDYELFNFYCPASNSEGAATGAVFEVVAINAPSGTNDNTAATNRYRNLSFEALHGGIKTNYIDIIGRIGNLVIEDTGDFRFSNLFKTSVPGETIDDYYVYGLVKKVDTANKNFVITSSSDIRGLSTNSLYGQDIYGLLTWLRNKLIGYPLSPDKNNINALKNEPLRYGYSVYLDISTLGKDYREIDIVPYYYFYNTSTRVLTPVDVYAWTDNGYQAINYHKDVYNGSAKKSVYDFRYLLDWEKEAAQRNVNTTEAQFTQSLSSSYGLQAPGTIKYLLGNASYLNFGEQARTFIGSSKTLGVEQNIGGQIASSQFGQSGKRWHFTLGLPSSAVVVETGTAPTDANIDKFKYQNGVVLMAADIYATSSYYTLQYKQNPGYFVMNGVTYTIPSTIPNVIAVYNGNGKSSRDDLEISKTH